MSDKQALHHHPDADPEVPGSGAAMDPVDTSGGSERLTLRYLLWFSLPLALTFLMMSGSAPIVSVGIARMHGAAGERTHLAAFLMTFVTALTIYSPMFVARNVAIRTIHDRRSLKRYVAFVGGCGLVNALVLLLVSRVDLFGHFVYGICLHADAEMEAMARQGLLVFVPVPILVALRGLGQGCHITNENNWYVGFGTGLRLIMMAVFVFGYGIRSELSGPILGGLTYLIGIGSETVFVLAMLWNKPQWTVYESGPVLSYAQFAQYAFPLMSGAFFNQLSGPILIHLINKGRFPDENGATFDLMRGSAWLIFSTLMSLQPAVLRHATSRHNLGVILKYAGALLACLTTVAVVLATTPLKHWLYIDLFNVDNAKIVELTYLCLFWLIPIPLINVANLFTSALHTRSGRTLWVTAGNGLGLGLLVLAGVVLEKGTYDGVIVAVVGNAVFYLAAATVQTIGLLNGGLAAALSPKHLADTMEAEAERRGAMRASPQPVPERA